MSDEIYSFSTLEEIKEKKEGILLVDKPTGWTSHDVVAWVRRQVGVKRVGHSGTLDPLATGLLIVLVGRTFTRLQDKFLKQEKSYLVRAKFGETTDTFDSQGKMVTKASWEQLRGLSSEKIAAVMKKYHGEIKQTVPAFSAVKLAGQKLYDLARRGEAVEQLPKRIVTIFRFDLKDFEYDEKLKKIEAEFVVLVSSGTYIRSLIHDLGQDLGVGAHVVVLRRLSIGQIDLKNAHVPSTKKFN